MINIKYQMWPVFCGAVDIDAAESRPATGSAR